MLSAIIFLVLTAFINLNSCDISPEKGEKYVSSFVEYLNSLPNQPYAYEEGVLLSANKIEENCYKIECSLKVSELYNIDSLKLLKCSATATDDGTVVTITHNHCEEVGSEPSRVESIDEFVVEDTTTTTSSEPPIVQEVQEAVHLHSEVQSNTGLTSGEQFVAVRREDPGSPCIGCSTHVDPQAVGVMELANLGVKHLDRHEPDVKHSLLTVFDVERMVQVVNGVRYILTMNISYDNCTTAEQEACAWNKVCKVSILEKPWVRMPDKSKYRAIVANNCTQEWQFGDNGEVIPNDNQDNSDNDNPEKSNKSNLPTDDSIKAVQNSDLQSSIITEKTLSVDEIKNLEGQIIPKKAVTYNVNVQPDTKDKNDEPEKENNIPSSNASPLSQDKKKAIDDLIQFFENVNLNANKVEPSRIKRSYSNELRVNNLVDKFQTVNKQINNAEKIQDLAQSIVNYANRMDMTSKNRILKEVVSAEEEVDGSHRFLYIRARVVVPCEKNNCKNANPKTELCKGIVEVSDSLNPQIYDSFCNKEISHVGKLNPIPLDDPILFKLVQEAIEKIEKESPMYNAYVIDEVSQAYVQRISGNLIRFSLVLSYTDCNKDLAFSQRSDCNLRAELGSKVCQVVVHEKHWLNLKQITYTCTEKPISENFLNKKEKEEDIENYKIQKVVEEALQYLEEQSNVNKRQKIMKVKSAKSRLVSGHLTTVDFDVAYTDCDSEKQIEIRYCNVKESEPRRSCTVEVWDRPWLQDGRKFNVTCDSPHPQLSDEVNKSRKKRSANLDFVGGPVPTNVDDPKYLELAKESTAKYLLESKIDQEHEVIKIETVTKQVVAGLLTKIEYLISPKDCKTDCKHLKCYSKIWEKSWEKFKEINVTCENVSRRSKRGKLGGEKEMDPNDPSYRELAEKSLLQYVKTSGNEQKLEIARVNKVTVKVVAGRITNVDFDVSAKETKEVFNCISEVWSKPWLNFEEIKVDCKPSSGRKKRNIFSGGAMHIVLDIKQQQDQQITGTEQEKTTTTNPKKGNLSVQNKTTETKAILNIVQKHDPSKPEYKELAQDSLNKYLISQNEENKHSVKEVIRVVTKVMSGILYDIDFKALPSDCLDNSDKLCGEEAELMCHSQIWHRPWSGQKEIDVTCNKNKPSKVEKVTKKPILSKKIENVDSLEQFESDTQDRNRRQDEEFIDEDTLSYYGHRAVETLNRHSDTHNLYKLITVHSYKPGFHMGTRVVRIYIETALTYCLRNEDEIELDSCDELEGLSHKLCFARIFPSSDDDLVVQHATVVCDDDKEFEKVSGLSQASLLRATLNELEKSPEITYKLINLGELDITPSLDSKFPTQLQIMIGISNCTKDVEIEKFKEMCTYDPKLPTSRCKSFVWMFPNTNEVSRVEVNCRNNPSRIRRDLLSKSEDNALINELVKESLQKLEMSSVHKYKQRLLKVNSYSTKIVNRKETTIDFDVAYTSCLKYEWVENITDCEILEHLPRKHCIAHVYERLWKDNGRQIEVNCEDDKVPLESIDFENANNGMELAQQALKFIEAKYPHPRKQKVVRVFSLEKQIVAGLHYRLKMEVGFTDCPALSIQENCKLVKDSNMNRFCRVNVWLRTWTDNPPSYRVTCDYQENNSGELYHHMQAEALFYDFITTYSPEYVDDHAQMAKRFEIFKNNVKKIHELNIHERGTARYAVTKFADLTYEEFSEKYLGLKPSLKVANQVPFPKAEIPDVELPPAFDWREFDAVTPVKNQGSCGSCWAFSVTGNIEGQWKIRSGELVSLSEQELVDCDSLDNGCDGGLPDNAYRAIEKMGGLETENDYPYEGEKDKCTFNKTIAKVKINGAVNITSDEVGMAKWLVSNGPISIGINANAMQFYTGGVSHPWKMFCNATNLDHGVLIVGYGVKEYKLFNKKLPYWIVKNSWGESWGLQGYYQVYRGDGTCGVNQMASSAVI